MVILGVVVICLLPGMFLAAALFPTRDSLTLAERLTLSMLMSLAATVAVGLLLCALHQFNAVALWAGLLIVTLVSLWEARRRQADWRGFLRSAREGARSRSALLWLIMLILSAINVLVWAENAFAAPVASLYYYNQAVTLVRLGFIPAQVLEYNTSMEFIANKIAHNLITAAFLLTGNLPTTAYGLVQFIVSAVSYLLAMLGLWSLGRRLMSPMLAAFFVLFVMHVPDNEVKFSLYRAEATGAALLFAALFCIERAFAHVRDRRWAVLAALSLSLAALVHGVAGLVGVVWYAAFAFAYLILERRAFFKRIPAMALTAALTGLLVLGILFGLGGGRINNQEVLSQSGAAVEVPAELGDPAANFRRIIFDDNLEAESQTVRPQEILSAALAHASQPLFSPPLANVLVVVVLLIAAVWAWRVQPQHPFVAASFAFLGLLLLLGMFFLVRGNAEGLAPLARHPLNREFPYLQTVSALVFALGLNALLQRSTSRRRVGWLEIAWIIALVSLLLAALLADVSGAQRLIPIFVLVLPVLWVVAVAAARAVQQKPLSVSRFLFLVPLLILGGLLLREVLALEANQIVNRYSSGRQALEWLAANTPPDAVVVTNIRTTGVVQVFAQRSSWTEGRAPYFQPENLIHALSVLMAYDEFYDCPNDAVLERYPVDYVVYVSGRSLLGRPFTGFNRESLARLRAYGRLTERASFENFHIYEVVNAPPQPQPDCLSEAQAQS